MITEYTHEIGIDEAGRGCLAGPVVAACFFIPPNFKPHKYLNDSKQIAENKRTIVFDYLQDNYFPYCGIGVVNAKRIDDINILQATYDAMHIGLDFNIALQQYSNKENITLIIDGDRFRPYKNLKHITKIKADTIYYSVAAASILAKVTRDNIMKELHNTKYECYNFAKHKGYATKEHYNLIKKYGISDIHRRSFRLTTINSIKLF